MKQRISRRQFLAAAGVAAAAGLLSACGATSTAASTASSASSATSGTAGASSAASAAAESDWAYISGKGELVIGVTQYEPMNYFDTDGTTWIGFDTEMAEAVCAKLGLTPVFQEIEWDNKVLELDAKNIDCIWNGMTVTDELAQSIDFSISYSENVQVCVINASNADTYTSVDTINASGVAVGAEAGSAGEAAAQENFPNASLTSLNVQRDCLLELKSGTLDVGVMDRTLAVSTTGEGTDFADLMVVDGLELTHEEFAVGLRKGSDFTEKLNETLQELAVDGTVAALAEKYPTVVVTL